MKNAVRVDGRGLDLNDSMGNIGPFSEDASDVLTTARGGGAARGRAQHWRRLRGPDGRRPGARRGDRRLRTGRSARSRPATKPSPTPSGPPDLRGVPPPLDRLNPSPPTTAALPRPEARGPRPQPDAARPAPPRPERAPPLPERGPADQGLETGLPALRDTLAELQPVTRRWTPSSPTSTRSSATWTSAPQRRRLHRQPFLRDVRDAAAHPRPDLAAAHLAPARDHQPRDALDPPAAPADQPRQRLHPAVRHRQTRSRRRTRLFPSHDCDNTTASGGRGSGRVAWPPRPPPQRSTFH